MNEHCLHEHCLHEPVTAIGPRFSLNPLNTFVLTLSTAISGWIGVRISREISSSQYRTLVHGKLHVAMPVMPSILAMPAMDAMLAMLDVLYT